jgi:hypothetical protein
MPIFCFKAKNSGQMMARIGRIALFTPHNSVSHAKSAMTSPYSQAILLTVGYV